MDPDDVAAEVLRVRRIYTRVRDLVVDDDPSVRGQGIALLTSLRVRDQEMVLTRLMGGHVARVRKVKALQARVASLRTARDHLEDQVAAMSLKVEDAQT